MRLLICAGGTGGGVYPALAVWRHAAPYVEETLWIGRRGGIEEHLVPRAGIPLRLIPAAGVHGVGLRQLPRNTLQLLRGLTAARTILRDFRPDVIFTTGGYLAVPVGLTGRAHRLVLYIPDIEPGLALKTLIPLASHIAVTADVTRKFLPRSKPVTVTGYPIRDELRQWTRSAARKALNLPPAEPVLLVYGGSLGALSINQAVWAQLETLLPHMHIVHITGASHWAKAQQRLATLPASLKARYHPFPYLHENMGAALAAADLALTRAGAATLGELPYFGLPAILVPYPHAWRYQKVNAEYLRAHGGAVILEDAHLERQLVPAVLSMIKDAHRLEEMRRAMAALRRTDAAQRIAQILLRENGGFYETARIPDQGDLHPIRHSHPARTGSQHP